MNHKLSLLLIINFSLLIINCAFGTSYTWTGTTSTAWNVSSNWNPSSGFPSTSDNVTISQASGNMPVLDTVRTIANLTLSRGTLDLGGFTLTSTGTISVTAGTGTRAINNGKLVGTGSSITINSATIGAKLDLNSASVVMSTNTFNSTVKVTKTGSSGSLWEGTSIYNDTLIITNTGSGYLGLSNYTGSHTFNAPVYFTTTSTGVIYPSYWGNSTYKCYFNYDIHVNINSSGGSVQFGQASYVTTPTTELASGKNLIFDQFGIGTIALGQFKRYGSGTWAIDLSSNSSNKIVIGPYCDIPFKLDLKAGIVNVNKTTFSKPLKVTTTSTTGSAWYGNSTYNDTLSINITNTASLVVYNDNGSHTFNAPVYLNSSSSGAIYIAGWATSGTKSTFNDDIHINIGNGGSVLFGQANYVTVPTTELASGKNIIFDQFVNGTIALGQFKRLGSGTWTIDHSSSTANKIYVGPYCDIPYTLNLKAGIVNITKTTFSKPLHVTTAGSAGSTWHGSSVYNDTLSITNTGTSNVMLSNEGGSHTFNAPVYFNLTSTGGIYAASFATTGNKTFINDDLHINIASGGTVNFGYGNYVTIPTTELASGKNIIFDQFTGGSLSLSQVKLIGTSALSLTASSTSLVSFGIYSEINRQLTLSAGRITTTSATYNSDVSFTTTGSSTSYSYGGNTFNGNLTLANSGSGSHIMGYTAADKFYGNLTATQSSTGLIYLAYTGSNELKGNLTLTQNNVASIGNGGGTLVFNGTSNQTITKSGSVNPEFGKLTINKASGSVIQASEVKINTILTLTNGKLQTGSNTLHLGNGGTMSGASSSSFVEGTFKKTGNQAFTFPVGKSGVYAPVTITAPSTTTDAFTAEYVNGSPNGTYPLSQKDTSLHDLDSTGYWLMSRPTGSSTPTVTVNFGIRCGTTSASTLIFAQWDAATSKWKDKGNGANTSTTLTHTGSIAWATGVKPILIGKLTPMKVNAGSDVAYCYGSSTGLSATVSNGTSAFSYAWTPTTGLSSATVYNPTVSATSSRDNVVTVMDSRNCVAKDTVAVTVNSLPNANAGSDRTTAIGHNTSIGASTVSGYSYSWSPTTGLSSSTVSNPSAPSTTETYTLTVTDTHGCSNTDNVTITGKELPTMPNCVK